MCWTLAIGPISPSAFGEAVAAARLLWPTVDVPDERFAAYLAERLPPGATGDEALRGLRTSDLYLACACVAGDANAIAAFERHCLSVLDGALPRLGMGADLVAEVKQRLRGSLLVGDDGPPRIAGFSGSGALRGWLRVMGVREGLAIVRQAGRHQRLEDDRLAEVVSPTDDPELHYLKATYRREFTSALEAAMQRLTDRERLLLRQQFLDGLSAIHIAKLYRVHRVTVGRWLDLARDKLLTATRDVLVARLDLAPADFESLMRLIDSRLEVSLRALLGPRRSASRKTE